jgi:hypothetical protein
MDEADSTAVQIKEGHQCLPMQIVAAMMVKRKIKSQNVK